MNKMNKMDKMDKMEVVHKEWLRNFCLPLARASFKEPTPRTPEEECARALREARTLFCERLPGEVALNIGYLGMHDDAVCRLFTQCALENARAAAKLQCPKYHFIMLAIISCCEQLLAMPTITSMDIQTRWVPVEVILSYRHL
jgi:hypothetical protein